MWISMIIIQPNEPKLTYSKQLLQSDELPYFVQGKGRIILNVKNTNVAPAICYESLQLEHSLNAYRFGAEIFLASAANSQNGKGFYTFFKNCK